MRCRSWSVTGARRDAFETLVATVAEEGWFTRGLSRSLLPSAVPHQTLRESPQHHNNAGSGAEVLSTPKSAFGATKAELSAVSTHETDWVG